MNSPLLRVKDLRVEIATRKGVVRIIDDLSFDINRGKTLGIVGESGSGKSMTALALMDLLPENATCTGLVEFNGHALKPNSRAHRSKIGMIFQDPMTSLNPCYTIEFQISEMLHTHLPQKWNSKDLLKARVRELLHQVGIPSPDDRMSAFPHQLSGGMSQRVMIAMALAAEPELLIADEPTTALDVTIQAQILILLKNLQKSQGLSMVLITHDMGVVGQMSDDILVLYGGYSMELGPKESVIRHGVHPYTEALMHSIPAAAKFDDFRLKLPVLEGSVPNLLLRPSGCQFHPRCRYKTDICSERAPAFEPSGQNQDQNQNHSHIQNQSQKRDHSEVQTQFEGHSREQVHAPQSYTRCHLADQMSDLRQRVQA
jgi:dipeptide transport system ATP-binding protein